MRRRTKVECWKFKEGFQEAKEADEIEIWAVFDMTGEYEFDTFHEFELIRVTACMENSPKTIYETKRSYFIDNTLRS